MIKIKNYSKIENIIELNTEVINGKSSEIIKLAEKDHEKRLDDDGRTVAATDCLCPGIGEVIGASQREERLDVLLERMKECGLSEEDYKEYLDSRRFGSVVHSGFGLGFERLIMYVTGVQNIRDVIPYPRTVGNI